MISKNQKTKYQKNRYLGYCLMGFISCFSLFGCGGGGGNSPSGQNDETPPSIGLLSDVEIEADIPSDEILIAVSDNRDRPEQLAIGVQTSDQTVVNDDGIQLSVSNGYIRLVLTPIADSIGQTTLTLNVSDRAGNTTIDRFIVNVIPRQITDIDLIQTLSDLSEDDAPLFINQLLIDEIVDDATGFDAFVNE